MLIDARSVRKSKNQSWITTNFTIFPTKLSTLLQMCDNSTIFKELRTISKAFGANVLLLCFRKNIVYPSLKDTISASFAVPTANSGKSTFPALILQI
jgi:hypothetical protein